MQKHNSGRNWFREDNREPSHTKKGPGRKHADGPGIQTPEQVKAGRGSLAGDKLARMAKELRLVRYN